MTPTHIVHAIGFVLGLGGALVSAGLMLRIGTDDEQRRRRGKLVRRICLTTWLGLALLIGSGIPLTLANAAASAPLHWMVLKHILVAVILIDAAIIHGRLFPRYFRALGTPDFEGVYRTMRGVGMLSVTCWILTTALSPLLGH